jgi:transcriptional regulator GlxA family with amidase domain
VVFLQRPGGQAQFSVWNETSSPATPALREVLDSVVLDPAANHSTAAMAARAAMSARHLTRIFREEVGMTPASYVEQARLEAAKLLLVTSEDSQECVARRAGFGTAETMRRIFHRNIGVSRASTVRVSAPLESSVPALHPACPSGSFRDRYQTIAAMRPHHRAKGAAPELVVV